MTKSEAPKADRGVDADAKQDSKPQFERRRSGSNPTRNPDGLHSANPVVLSGNGDATQPVKPKDSAE